MNFIPDDWDGVTYRFWMLCAPQSPEWDRAVRNSVRTLTRGRFWDFETGDFLPIQQTAWEIYDSMTTCDDLIASLQAIATSIQNQQLQASIQVDCCDQLTQPDPPTPLPEPLPDPATGPPPPAYGGDLAAYDAEVCRMANAYHWQIRRWLNFLYNLDGPIAVVSFLVALALVVFPEPASTAIGGVTLAYIIALVIAAANGLQVVSEWAEDAIVLWDGYQVDIVCFIYNYIDGVQDLPEALIAYTKEKLNEVTAPLPLNIDVDLLFSWLEAYMAWYQDELYNFIGTLPDHPSPVPCDCTPPCNDCQWTEYGTIHVDNYSTIETANLSNTSYQRVNVFTSDMELRDLGGGYPAGQIKLNDLNPCQCSYCLEIITGRSSVSDGILTAAFSNNDWDVPNNYAAQYQITIPANTPPDTSFLLPIANVAGAGTMPLRLMRPNSGPEIKIKEIRVKWLP